MKTNKNNTCKICRQHIDKSDASSSWTTIIHSSIVVGDDSEKGYHIIKGERYTLCSVCSSLTVRSAVRKELETQLNKEVQ